MTTSRQNGDLTAYEMGCPPACRASFVLAFFGTFSGGGPGMGSFTPVLGPGVHKGAPWVRHSLSQVYHRAVGGWGWKTSRGSSAFTLFL